MIESRPQLWSDFEGTAVLKAHLLDPRDVTKYPLPVMEGYSDFLQGARLSDDTDGGQDRVEIAGIITKQSDVFIRRMAMERSVVKLGLSEFFPDRSQLVRTGSDQLTAAHLAHESETARIGMLEDRPHKLGAELLKIMATQVINGEVDRLIVLGVVSGDKSATYIEALLADAKATYGDDVDMSEFDYQADEAITNVGQRIKLGKATLEVVQLARYSQAAGAHFSRHLLGPEPEEPEPEHVSFGKKVGEFIVNIIGPATRQRIRRSTERSIVRATAFAVHTVHGERKVTVVRDSMRTDMEVSVKPIPPADK